MEDKDKLEEMLAHALTELVDSYRRSFTWNVTPVALLKAEAALVIYYKIKNDS